MAPSLVVDLTGYGAHRQVEIHVPAASDLCTEGSVDSDRQNSISLTFQLPPVIMVDPYELDTALGKDVTLRLEGNLDLERYCSDDMSCNLLISECIFHVMILSLSVQP